MYVRFSGACNPNRTPNGITINKIKTKQIVLYVYVLSVHKSTDVRLYGLWRRLLFYIVARVFSVVIRKLERTFENINASVIL